MAEVGSQTALAVRISVVAPCFGEEEVLPAFYARCKAALTKAVGDAYEIVFVNDGSNDGTWAAIEGLVALDPHVVGIDLARNFGQQYALSAGLSMCRGELVLIIDADLQDPPELVVDMLAELDKGADVVYGQRIARDGEVAWKRATSHLFYRLINRLSDVAIPHDVGDFRLMRRAVVDALLTMPEQNRFVRGMIAWLGFRQVALPYHRDARYAGITKYRVGPLVRLAVDGITSFSIIPLRLTSLFGLLFCLVALLVLIYSLASWLFWFTVPGWTSMITVVCVVGGIQLLCLGIATEYLGRIYMEVKRRPLFVIREISTRSGWTPRDQPRRAVPDAGETSSHAP